MEFKSFPKIERIGKVNMSITQKIHGTNAQVFIKLVDITFFREEFTYSKNAIRINEEYYALFCGSRTRWITPEDDNYGFAKFVYENKEEFINCLGVGQHFGEWAGPGINSGEGLEQKTFVLFDHWKFPPERKLPPQTVVVPVLYQGLMDLAKIDEVMNELKTTGSKLAPGFMRPEGIVINAMGTRYKKVFEAEETRWKSPDKVYQLNKVNETEKVMEEYGHLLQPIRLEKLLSKDERYIKEFPKSFNEIVTDYFTDLVEENQVAQENVKDIRKNAGSIIFKFVREQLKSKGIE